MIKYTRSGSLEVVPVRLLVMACLLLSPGCARDDAIDVAGSQPEGVVAPAPKPYEATVLVTEQRGASRDEYSVDVSYRGPENWTAVYHDDSRLHDGIEIVRRPGRYTMKQPSYDPRDVLTQKQIDTALASLTPEQWQDALAKMIDSGQLEYRQRTSADEFGVSDASYAVPADLPILAAVAAGPEKWSSENGLTRAGSGVFQGATARLETDSSERPAVLHRQEPGPVGSEQNWTEYRLIERRAT